MAPEKLSCLSAGGLMVGMSKDGKQIYIDSEDTHTLTMGATRSGKSRTVVLPSVCLMALAGESMIVVDPKAELYLYTRPFLERLGYEVVALDFRNPAISNQYNFLQPVIDKVNDDNIPGAIQSARDIAAMLVTQNERTEPIWIDGQRAALTMGILAVVKDNVLHPEYQNLSNARQFVAKMCTPGPGGTLPIVRYLKDRPKDHPAQMAMDIANIAPAKTRGSFYTSALVTLDLFTDPGIHSMTAATDFDHTATGTKKRALFIILPDDRSTYYPLASLFVYQHYQTLSEVAQRNGHRLPIRTNFICDEFGNFTKIPEFSTLFTVGAGRGIRFHLFLQDFSQLTEKYGPNVSKTLRSNAATWIYLSSKDPEVRSEISKLLDNYTTKSSGMSGSTGGQTSASYNLISRPLLTPGELEHIKRPYQLVLGDGNPAIMYAPDLSQTIFNKLLGLGDMEYNRQLIIARSQERVERPISTAYWNIWDYYIRQAYVDAVNAAQNKGEF